MCSGFLIKESFGKNAHYVLYVYRFTKYFYTQQCYSIRKYLLVCSNPEPKRRQKTKVIRRVHGVLVSPLPLHLLRPDQTNRSWNQIRAPTKNTVVPHSFRLTNVVVELAVERVPLVLCSWCRVTIALYLSWPHQRRPEVIVVGKNRTKNIVLERHRVLVKVPVAAKIKVTAEHSVRVLWSRPGEEGHRVPEDAVGQGLLVHDAGRLLQL